jgi:hypothetical protein
VPETFYRPEHGGTLNWYVRLVPPTALKGRPDVKEFRKSSGTADLGRAKVIGAQLIAEKRTEWEKLPALAKPATASAQVLTTEQVEHISARRLYHWMHIDDAGGYQGLGHDDASLAADAALPSDRPVHAIGSAAARAAIDVRARHYRQSRISSAFV